LLCAAGPIICQAEINGCVTFADKESLVSNAALVPGWNTAIALDGVVIVGGFGPPLQCQTMNNMRYAPFLNR
jgi:hypothetical protein